MKKFVLGDVHGAYKSLIQVFEKSNFDFLKDKVYFLGDIVDGWSQSKECIDFIMSIPNKEIIMGNHDEWAMYYYTKQVHYNNNSVDSEYLSWKTHGGWETIKSLGDLEEIDKKYIEFFQSMKYFHEEDGNLFVHAGYSDLEDDNGNIFHPSKQHPYLLCWDREFIHRMYRERKNTNFKLKSPWKEIFVGHTPTTDFNDFYTTPKNWHNVWNMDTGSAFHGKVSMMNIETKEIFQSEQSRKLYPNEKGRNDKSWL